MEGFASNSANAGVGEMSYFSLAFYSRGRSKIGPFIGRFTPKKFLGGMWAKRALSASLLVDTLASCNYACNLMPSCSSTIVHRSLVFLAANFVLGHRKPSRNRPETARHSGVPGCLQILSTMELKGDSKCRVPGCIHDLFLEHIIFPIDCLINMCMYIHVYACVHSFSDNFRSLWNHFGINLEQFVVHFEIMLGPFWDHSGCMLQPF